MERKFFTSDLHFGHANIIKYTSRPYETVDEMNEDLVRRWNEVITAEDTVWILGDLCMGKVDESLLYVGQLNGFKHLIPGNHDKMFGCEGTKYANMVQKYLDGGVDRVDEPQVRMTPSGVEMGSKYDVPGVLACHFPYVGDHEDTHEDRYQEYRPTDRGDFLMHGHTHGLWRKRGRMVDVGVDAWGGYPVSFANIAELLSSGVETADPLEWKAAKG